MKKVKCFLLSEGKYYGIQAALSQSPFSWRDFCWTHRALYSFLTCDRKNNLGDCSTLTSWVTLFGGKTQALHLRARGREQGKTTTSGSSPTFKSPAFSPEALSSWHHRAHVRAQRKSGKVLTASTRTWLAHYSGHICGRGTAIRKGGTLKGVDGAMPLVQGTGEFNWCGGSRGGGRVR